MSRVHCLDCGMSVVVDPGGVCPEGHIVGAAGARVASAIGSDIPYPDEPEPWVSRVDLDDEPAEEPLVRAIRPVSAPGLPAIPEPVDAPVDSEELLRELHSLSDLSGSRPVGSPLHSPAPTPRVPPATVTPPAAPAPTPADPTPPAPATPPAAASPAPPTSSPATPAPRPATPPATPAPRPVTTSNGSGPTPPSANGDGADTLAELSALEAAVQALDIDQSPSIDFVSTNGHQPVVRDEPQPPRESNDANTLAQLESLFSAPSAPNPPPAAERGPAPHDQPATPADASPPDAAPAPLPADEPADEQSAVLALLADVAESADSAVEPASDALATPVTEPSPDEGSHAEDGGSSLDLASFTARGRRVGRREAAKRKRRGRH